jgi:hypothetical protein
MNAPFRQTKLDGKAAVYDIGTRSFSKLDGPAAENDTPVCGGGPAAVR